MELTPGDFIYHSHHGVGRIQISETPEPTIPINGIAEFDIKFQNGEVKTFTAELLQRGAHKISPAGFRAYAYLDEAGAKELLATNPVEAITMVLQDFPGLVAKNEDFKDYLAPYLSDWEKWWETAQPKLKESPQIDTSRTKFREYGLRNEALSPAEELYRAFVRIRPFEDKAIVYDQARRTLTEYRNDSFLAEEHIQDVLEYLRNTLTMKNNPPAMRLDAVFRLQDGKWLMEEQAAEYISMIIGSGVRLYQLDLFSLNRMVEFLLASPLSSEQKSLLASGICSGETTIQALCDWALKRGDSEFIALLLVTALSENILPQLAKENMDVLAVRLKYAESLIPALEFENPAWSAIVSHLRSLVREISQLDARTWPPLLIPLLGFSQTLYGRIREHHPYLAQQILDDQLAPSMPRQFILDLLDAARGSKRLVEFGSILEKHVWSTGEDRGADFVRALVQSKGSTLEQVRALVESAEQYDSPSLKGHVGGVVYELIKKDEQTDRVLFLPFLNKLHQWGHSWSWSTPVEGLREGIYLEALEHPHSDFGDQALVSAIKNFLGNKMRASDETQQQLEKEVQQAAQKISQLEGLLAERDQVVRELRSGYGGDTAEARFGERVRIVKELASSLAEFERMDWKMAEKSREVQAVIVRLNSILSGLGVIPMEAIGSRVKFNPQKHQAVGVSVIGVGEEVVVMEKGYLIRDSKEKLRLLKSALVTK
jgi:molecular chaperone GrpE (heat shock protein)